MDGILNLPLSLWGGLKNPPFFPKSKSNMANLFENTSLWGHVKVSICYANLEKIMLNYPVYFPLVVWVQIPGKELVILLFWTETL